MNSFWNCGLLLFVICCTSCKKKAEPLPVEPVTESVLDLSYTTDNGSFDTDIIKYTNAAGYLYSVTRLEFYLSQISFIKADSTRIELLNYKYVNASRIETNKIPISDPPVGEFIGISFNIGLDPLHNVTDALAVNTDNINMQWPEPMGGGYHFLKLEGYYIDGSGTQGYAMHLGTNTCLMPVRLFKSFSIAEGSSTSLQVIMNVNNWFKHPYVYDFNKEGNYIMGNDTAMLKIAENGKNVFSILK